jgi:hypothetical protein
MRREKRDLLWEVYLPMVMPQILEMVRRGLLVWPPESHR